jgi:ketosteroid isomerase-like protein
MTHDVATRLSHETVQAWLDAYERAWETYDPDQIGALFSDDAEYRWHPADEPEKGREAIVFAWLNPGGNASDRDAPGTYLGEYRP